MVACYRECEKNYLAALCDGIPCNGSEVGSAETDLVLLDNPIWVRPACDTIQSRTITMDFSNFIHGLWKKLEHVVWKVERNHSIIARDQNDMMHMLGRLRDGVLFPRANQETRIIVRFVAASCCVCDV